MVRVCMSVCECALLKKKNQSTFTSMFSVRLWHLPVRTCARQKQHIHTGNACVRLVGPCVHLRGVGGVWRYGPVLRVVDE